MHKRQFLAERPDCSEVRVVVPGEDKCDLEHGEPGEEPRVRDVPYHGVNVLVPELLYPSFVAVQHKDPAFFSRQFRGHVVPCAPAPENRIFHLLSCHMSARLWHATMSLLDDIKVTTRNGEIARWKLPHGRVTGRKIKTFILNSEPLI